MSKVKFTPGPWFAGYHDFKERWCVGGNIEGTVAIIDPEQEAHEANAALIAAAPEMYEALEYALACAEGRERDYVGTLMRQIRDALAKARGETTDPDDRGIV